MSLVQNAIASILPKQMDTQRLPMSNSPLSTITTGISTVSDTARLGRMDAVGWLFAGIDLIATSVAATEWKVYRRRGTEREEIIPQSRELRPNDPGLALFRLWHEVNPFYTREQFLEATQQHYELLGREFWLLLRPNDNPNLAPVEMWPIRPDRLRPVASRQHFIEGWVYNAGAEKIPVRREDVIWIRRPHPIDAYGSISVISALNNDIESDRQAALYTRKFFENDATPGGIIQVEGLLEDHELDKLREHWRSQHQGAQNAHRVAIIEQSTWVDRKVTQRDMQFEQLRKLDRDIILGAMKIQPALLGITENVNLANARMALVIHNEQVVLPRLRKIRAEINEQLAPQFADDLELDFVDPTPANREQALQEATELFNAKLTTRDESRAMVGLDMAAEGGDDYALSAGPALQLSAPRYSGNGHPKNSDITALISGKVNDPLQPAPVEEAEEAMIAGWTRRLAAEAEEVIAELNQFKSHTKVEVTDLDGHDWDWWVKYGGEVEGELSVSYTVAAQSTFADMPVARLQQLAAQYARQRGADLLRLDGDINMVTATRERVRELTARTIERGDSLQTLQKSLRDDFVFSKNRAAIVARTETATALGQGRKQMGIEQGHNEKRWFTQGAADPRVDEVCLANEAQGWIPTTRVFTSGADTVPQHVSCMCNVITRFNPDVQRGAVDRAIIEVRCPECNRFLAKAVPYGAFYCSRCKKLVRVGV